MLRTLFVILLAVGFASPVALADMGRVSSPVTTSQDSQAGGTKPAETVGQR